MLILIFGMSLMKKLVKNIVIKHIKLMLILNHQAMLTLKMKRI